MRISNANALLEEQSHLCDMEQTTTVAAPDAIARVRQPRYLVLPEQHITGIITCTEICELGRVAWSLHRQRVSTLLVEEFVREILEHAIRPTWSYASADKRAE